MIRGGFIMGDEFQFASENRPSQKEIHLNQPLVFRGENVSFREGTLF